jgi:hypothetical protein
MRSNIRLAVTNILAYYATQLVTTVKKFCNFREIIDSNELPDHSR